MSPIEYGIVTYSIGNYDSTTDVTTITIDFAREDIEHITWQDGIDLISSETVVPNQLYHITDRGWYLEGLTSTSLNLEMTLKLQETMILQQMLQQLP